MPDSAFDAWYNEIEGFALRAERLAGPKAELMAAFEAGVEAERERCAKVADQYGDKAHEAREENAGGDELSIIDRSVCEALGDYSRDIASAIRSGKR